jgi:hypothetical protein
MRHRCAWAAACIIAISPFSNSVSSQEMGSLQTFGADGRLFSSGHDDYFLLSRQGYATEDSSGYEGQVRIKKNHPNGGYEIIMRDYLARCRSYDRMVYVVWFDAGERDQGGGHNVDIKNQGASPGSAEKDSYNLYWAACQGQFRKFK